MRNEGVVICAPPLHKLNQKARAQTQSSLQSGVMFCKCKVHPFSTYFCVCVCANCVSDGCTTAVSWWWWLAALLQLFRSYPTGRKLTLVADSGNKGAACGQSLSFELVLFGECFRYKFFTCQFKLSRGKICTSDMNVNFSGTKLDKQLWGCHVVAWQFVLRDFFYKFGPTFWEQFRF